MPDVKPTDPSEASARIIELFPPHSYRWAVYDRPSWTLWFGSAAAKSHLTVAEESRLLANDPSYYRPGPAAKMIGGYLARSREGAFYFDPYSGTFPGTNEAVHEAEEALREWCRAQGYPWKAYQAGVSEFSPADF